MSKLCLRDFFYLLINFTRCKVEESWRKQPMQTRSQHRLREDFIDLELFFIINQLFTLSEKNLRHWSLWRFCFLCTLSLSRRSSLFVLLLLKLFELLLCHVFSTLLILCRSSSRGFLFKRWYRCFGTLHSRLLGGRRSAQAITSGARDCQVREELECVLNRFINGLKSAAIHRLNWWKWC